MKEFEDTPVCEGYADEISKSFINLWDIIYKFESSCIGMPGWSYRLISVPVTLLIGLVIGVYLTCFWNGEEPGHSPLRSVSEWTLPDSTEIFLNAASKSKYGIDLVVQNAEILVHHCDGTFKNEEIIEVLEIIKKTLPINYKIVGQQIEITSK